MQPDHYLDTFIEECKQTLPPEEREDKAIDDYVLTVLVTYGLTQLLPELKQWVKLGTTAIALKRLELEKRLEQYAARKELDMGEARKAGKAVAQNINQDNVKQLIESLEQREARENTD